MMTIIFFEFVDDVCNLWLNRWKSGKLCWLYMIYTINQINLDIISKTLAAPCMLFESILKSFIYMIVIDHHVYLIYIIFIVLDVCLILFLKSIDHVGDTVSLHIVWVDIHKINFECVCNDHELSLHLTKQSSCSLL